MKTIKFLVINAKSSDKDVTVVCEDGGIACLHFNGEHMVATLYQDRITPETDLENLFEELGEGKAYIEDFSGMEPTPQMIIHCINWLNASPCNELNCIDYREYDGDFEEIMGSSYLQWIEEFLRKE